jgi:CRP-like cAMP-binding protein
LERSAYLLSFIWARAGKVNLVGKGTALLPITQQHVADTLGLSLVHTNRTLRKLVDRKLIVWRDGGCEVLDFEALTKAARWEGLRESLRPLV